MTTVGESVRQLDDLEPLPIPGAVPDAPLDLPELTIADFDSGTLNVIADDHKVLNRVTARAGSRNTNKSAEYFLRDHVIPLDYWHNYAAHTRIEDKGRLVEVTREARVACNGVASVLTESLLHNQHYRVIRHTITLAAQSPSVSEQLA